MYLLDTLRPSDTLPTVSSTPELYQLIQFDFQLISVKKVQLYQITSLRRALIQLHFLFLFFRQTCNQNCKDDQTHAGNDVGHHTGGKTGAFGHDADDPGHQDRAAGRHRQHDAHAGHAGHTACAGHSGGVHARHRKGKGEQQHDGRALTAGLHQQDVEDGAAHAHDHHGLAGLLEGEHEGDEQTCHEGRAPHDGDGIGRQCACDDAAALEVSDHPAGDALLSGVLAEEQAGQQPEAGGSEEAPIGDFLLARAPARKGSPHIHQPEQQTQHSQHQHGEGAAHPACRRDEKGAEQCAAGIAAVHQVHAPGAVSGVVADEDGAGIDDTALGDAHEEEAQRQHSHRAAEAHHGVAQRIADGQQQDAGLHAQLAGQHGDEKACQQVADAHEGQQGSGHAVGKAILLLQ